MHGLAIVPLAYVYYDLCSPGVCVAIVPFLSILLSLLTWSLCSKFAMKVP